MKIKCYGCGLEGDANLFVTRTFSHNPRAEGVGFHCPQCLSYQPKLAPLFADHVPWPKPKWEVVETSTGVSIRHYGGCTVTSPMVAGHHLENAPASILRPGLEGTLRDHSERLKADGEARSASFKADREAWLAANPEPLRNTHEHIDWQEARKAATDRFREENGVGDHYEATAHDGPKLEWAARRAKAKSRAA